MNEFVDMHRPHEFQKEIRQVEMPESEAVSTGRRISVDDLADAVMENLMEYADIASNDVKKAVPCG